MRCPFLSLKKLQSTRGGNKKWQGNRVKKRKLEEEKHRKLGEEEKKKLKELHFMRCPKCGMELIEIFYNGVHTDKCSECGGIWLDAGEFETLSKSDKSILNGLFGMFTK
jgi:hypothetical protein